MCAVCCSDVGRLQAAVVRWTLGACCCWQWFVGACLCCKWVNICVSCAMRVKTAIQSDMLQPQQPRKYFLSSRDSVRFATNYSVIQTRLNDKRTRTKKRVLCTAVRLQIDVLETHRRVKVRCTTGSRVCFSMSLKQRRRQLPFGRCSAASAQKLLPHGLCLS